MIVPRLELRNILDGKVGEIETSDHPPAVGDVFWLRETPRVAPACRGRVAEVRPVRSGGWAVLLERFDEVKLPRPIRPERPGLRLTRSQRAKLFDGECPYIGGTGICPVKAGDRVELSSRVTLRVSRVDPQRGGKWALMYELIDSRDPVRLLRRTPPAHREGPGYELPTDPAAQEAATRDAAEESAYTSSLHGLVDEAGEAPPKQWLDVRAKTVREFRLQRQLKQQTQELRDRSKAKRKRAA